MLGEKSTERSIIIVERVGMRIRECGRVSRETMTGGGGGGRLSHAPQ